MGFHTYTTMRDWTRRADPEDRLAQDIDQFYRRTLKDAVGMAVAKVRRPDEPMTTTWWIDDEPNSK
jgi:hypothetical protein